MINSLTRTQMRTLVNHTNQRRSGGELTFFDQAAR